MNKIILTGTIFKDMNYKPSNGNAPSVIRFTLSVKQNFKSSRTGKYEYDYIPCTAWRQTADFINKHFKDGDVIEVSDARLQNNNWEKDGVKHYDLVVNVEQVEFPVNAYVGHDSATDSSSSSEKVLSEAEENEIARLEFERIISEQNGSV